LSEGGETRSFWRIAASAATARGQSLRGGRRQHLIGGLAALAAGIGAAAAFAQERGAATDPGFERADNAAIDDPAGVFAAGLAAVLAGEPRAQALRAFVDRWAASDPEAAALAVESLSRNVLREGLGEITGRRWAERDPDAAIDWATRFGDLSVWSGVVVGIAGIDPERALTVATGLPSRGGGALVNVAIAAAAAEHWQHAGLGELNPYTANHIARNWVAHDRAAAERWALGVPAGAGRDSALITIVASAELGSAHAAELVNEIHSEQFRAAAARGWIQAALRRGDPTLADFRSRLLLPDSVRAELDKQFPR
jgi:hypothetical protein